MVANMNLRSLLEDCTDVSVMKGTCLSSKGPWFGSHDSLPAFAGTSRNMTYTHRPVDTHEVFLKIFFKKSDLSEFQEKPKKSQTWFQVYRY